MLASTWNVAKTTSPSQRYSGSQDGALLLLRLPPHAPERRAVEGESGVTIDDISRPGDERSFGEACGVAACRLCCCWCRGDVGNAMGYRSLSVAIVIRASLHFV